jgi:hypothetical protein
MRWSTPPPLILLAAVGCVLLIACVSLRTCRWRAALARGGIAMRAAPGASRRARAPVLTESLALAVLNGLRPRGAGSIALLAQWSPVSSAASRSIIDGAVLYPTARSRS